MNKTLNAQNSTKGFASNGLLRAAETACLLVDCANFEHLATANVQRERYVEALQRLSSLWTGLDIRCWSTTTPNKHETQRQLADVMLPKSLMIKALNPLMDDALRGKILAAGRRQLLIAGLYVEGTVSLAALLALELGLDVFVVRDATLGFTELDSDTAFGRLVQAGVVLTTSRQVILEIRSQA